MLARLLFCAGIATVVFEKDQSPDSRKAQGGTLDMHENTGQKALIEAGLWDQFQGVARYDAEDLIITDRHNRVYYESRGES